MFYVFSHFPCNDGEVSRMVWQYFVPNSVFYGWKHNDTATNVKIIEDLPPNSDIVFLDLSPPLYTLPIHHNYIVIDHHKDAIITMRNNPKFGDYKVKLYIENGFPENNKLSGCMLTWMYHSQDPFPSVVKHIGSKDVWDFSDPNTEPYIIGYNLALAKCESQDARINFIMDLFEKERDNEFINVGLPIIAEYKEKAITVFENVSYDSEVVGDTEYTIVEVKCTDYELFKYLIEYAEEHIDMDVLRILHSTKDGKSNYSLRSIKKDVKVDGIARKYGGNGHERAAGYSITSN
jgi:hypothetical protein